MDLRDVIAGRTPAQTQNLANPVSVSISKPAGFYKSIALDVLSVAAALFFGFVYYRYLIQQLSVWELLAALTLYAIITVLQTLLTKNALRRSLVILFEAAALFVFFRTENLEILGITAGAVFLILIWGYFSARSRLANSIEVPFFGAATGVLGKFTTALIVFMILAYVPQLNADPANGFVSRQSFGGFFDWAAGVVGNFYPGVTLTGTFGDFSQSLAKMELQNNPSFQNLNPENQGTAVTQATTQVEANIQKNVGMPISPTASTSDAFYSMIIGALNAWKGQASGSFAIGWAIVVFFLLRTIGIVFAWLAAFLCLIFYEILLAAGFMRITEETQTKEVLGY